MSMSCPQKANTFIFEPFRENFAQKGFLAADAVVNENNGMTPIRLVNVLSERVDLYLKNCLEHIEPVDTPTKNNDVVRVIYDTKYQNNFLTQKEKAVAVNMLNQYKNLLSAGKSDIGHEIKLNDNSPCQQISFTRY